MSVVLASLISSVLLVPTSSPLLLLLLYLVFALYTVILALSMACFMKKAKMAGQILLWGGAIMSAPVYANVGLLFDAGSAPVIPGAACYAIGALFAPFSFAQAREVAAPLSALRADTQSSVRDEPACVVAANSARLC